MTMEATVNTKKGGLQENYLVQAWLVLFLAVMFGAALAGVQMYLGPVIEQNKLNETLERVPALVLGEEKLQEITAAGQHLEVTPRTITVKKAGREKFYNVYEARLQGAPKGWVIKTKGAGYADNIELLFGLSPDLNTITGIFVLDQKETPGLGNKIVTDEWRGQFVNAPVNPPLSVVKTGSTRPGEIDAVTGATISSVSVTNIINTSIGDLRQPLAESPKQMEKGEGTNG